MYMVPCEPNAMSLTTPGQSVANNDVAGAEPLKPSAEVGVLIDDAIAGRRRVLMWPWSSLGKLSRALAPATVTPIVAGPGAAKSLMLVQAGAHWHEQGYRPALLVLQQVITKDPLKTGF